MNKDGMLDSQGEMVERNNTRQSILLAENTSDEVMEAALLIGSVKASVVEANLEGSQIRSLEKLR